MKIRNVIELLKLALEIAVFFVLVSWLMAEARGDVRQGSVLRDYFDKVEVNHVYNKWGSPRIDQIIFWDWDENHGRYVIEAYCMLDSDKVRVKTEEGKKRWEDRAEEWIRTYPPAEQKFMRQLVPYKGEYRITNAHPNLIGGRWVCIISEGNGVLRTVSCGIMRETHTLYDVEMVQRNFRPSICRKGLTKREEP